MKLWNRFNSFSRKESLEEEVDNFDKVREIQESVEMEKPLLLNRTAKLTK